jgi:signal-transduction protein with cAMP-binding, CBS, and nucleotidyltransferase domain
MKNKKVGDFMSAPAISINAEASIKDAGNLIDKNKVGSLLVKEGEGYVGIITKTDLVQKVILRDLDFETTKIQTIMTDAILTIDRGATIKRAVALMSEKQVRHLGVIENNDIVGVLSIKDISEDFSDQYIRIFY